MQIESETKIAVVETPFGGAKVVSKRRQKITKYPSFGVD